ncbi:hypothetical protein IGI50_003293 [Enterococcus sp. DIV0170]
MKKSYHIFRSRIIGVPEVASSGISRNFLKRLTSVTNADSKKFCPLAQWALCRELWHNSLSNKKFCQADESEIGASVFAFFEIILKEEVIVVLLRFFCRILSSDQAHVFLLFLKSDTINLIIERDLKNLFLKGANNMGNLLKLFGVAATTFLVLDLFWLLVFARRMYQDHLGHLMGQTKIVPAVLFYLLYLIGILFFIVTPALEKDSLFYAVAAGGFLGLLCYGTYDLTNLATLNNWPAFITGVDLIWGTAVTAAVSGVTVYVAQQFNWR